MNHQKLTEGISTVGVNRLLIDMIRDRLPPQNHRDYKTINHAANSLLFHRVDDTTPESMRRFDDLFRRKKLIDKNINTMKGVTDIHSIRFKQRLEFDRALRRFIEDIVRNRNKQLPTRTTHFTKNGKPCVIKAYKNNDGTWSWEEGL